MCGWIKGGVSRPGNGNEEFFSRVFSSRITSSKKKLAKCNFFLRDFYRRFSTEFPKIYLLQKLKAKIVDMSFENTGAHPIMSSSPRTKAWENRGEFVRRGGTPTRGV